ncbi:MAG: hypothetical protein AAF604_00840 [Acidobacteriota bacterium]
MRRRQLSRIRLSMTNKPEPDSLRCELFRGDESLTREATFPLADFGLAKVEGSRRSSRRGRRDPASVAHPASGLADFAASLLDFLEPGEVVWLELGRPKGILPLLPWERWLGPAIDHPILRLPRYFVRPVRPADRLQIAYCSSSPHAKSDVDVAELLGRTYQALHAAGVPADIQVFVDSAAADGVRSVVPSPGVDLTIHDATSSDGYADSAAATPLLNPWLRWMTASLPPRGVDLFHFVGHGYLSQGRGFLAYAQSPTRNTDPRWSRFIGHEELTTFLDLVGASALVLTSPPGNYSFSGLLGLADEVVATRPGPVITHDYANDPAGDALSTALAFLYGDSPTLPRSPAVSLVAHPDRLSPSAGESADQEAPTRSYSRPALGRGETESVDPPDPFDRLKVLFGTRGGDQGPEVKRRIRRDYTLEKVIRKRDEQRARFSRWVQSSQRILERHTAQLAAKEMASSKPGSASQKGREAALRYVAEVLGESSGDES